MRRMLVAAGAAVLVPCVAGLVAACGGGEGAGSGKVAAGDSKDSVRSTTASTDCDLPEGDATLADANLGFAWRSFRAIEAAERETKPKSTTYSPYSLATALHMLANGADDGTDAELLAALCLRGIDLGSLNDQARQLREELVAGREMTVSNGIFTVPGMRPAPRLDTVVRGDYDGELAELEGVDQVNHWIDQRTKHRIPKMLSELPDDIAMLLVNAITFDGTWKDTFEKARPGPFTLAGGEQVDVPMLRDERTLDYAFSEDDPDLEWADDADIREQAPDAFRMARIPYAGDRFAMVLVVPALQDGLDDVIDSLDADRWREVRARMVEQPVALAMPRLHLEEGRYIHEPVFGIGVPEDTYDSLFEPKPVDPAYISFIKQDTFLEVDERGTKAAAATVVGVSVSAGGPVGVPVQADHPYLLAIEDVTTGELVFISAVRDPRGAND